MKRVDNQIYLNSLRKGPLEEEVVLEITRLIELGLFDLQTLEGGDTPQNRAAYPGREWHVGFLHNLTAEILERAWKIGLVILFESWLAGWTARRISAKPQEAIP